MDLINHEDGHPIGQPSQVTRENIPTGKLQAVLGLFENLADIGGSSTSISYSLPLLKRTWWPRAP